MLSQVSLHSCFSVALHVNNLFFSAGCGLTNMPIFSRRWLSHFSLCSTKSKGLALCLFLSQHLQPGMPRISHSILFSFSDYHRAEELCLDKLKINIVARAVCFSLSLSVLFWLWVFLFSGWLLCVLVWLLVFLRCLVAVIVCNK